MTFSNSTDKDGLIQTVEFWSRLPDGSATGTLLKQLTARINRAFDSILPLVLSYSDHVRWDDTNHTDRPIGTTNLVSGQNDYTIATDDNSLKILNLTAVRILPSSSATTFIPLERIYPDDPRALSAMSPSSSETGAITGFVENGNTIFLDKLPNYSATNGLQLFFERQQSYFASTDTTKEPGIPLPFHELLALYAAYDYVAVNRSSEDGKADLLNIIGERIRIKNQDLKDMISLRNPTRNRITVGYQTNK